LLREPTTTIQYILILTLEPEWMKELGYCGNCGKEFVRTRLWHKYCSDRCRDHANNTSEKHRIAARHVNRELQRARAVRSRKKVRMQTLIHYGGDPPACHCPGGCTESHLEFLTIDHLEGHGREHRSSMRRNGTAFYVWLRKNSYPGGYRVLCYNCNCSLGNYGYCPHTKHKIVPSGAGGQPIAT